MRSFASSISAAKVFMEGVLPIRTIGFATLRSEDDLFNHRPFFVRGPRRDHDLFTLAREAIEHLGGPLFGPALEEETRSGVDEHIVLEPPDEFRGFSARFIRNRELQPRTSSSGTTTPSARR